MKGETKMAIIGFADDLDRPKGEEEKKLSGEEIVKMETMLESGRKSLYISPQRLAMMEATYGTVVVHDFGDDYHMTDEERESQNHYYQLFRKLNKCKRKYRKIDEFVDCARIAMEALDMVAENNSVYEPEKFKSLVLKGKLIVNGWFYPRYTGRDRKQLNWEYISDFILSDRPSEELLKKPSEEEFMTESEIEEESKRLFGEGELESLLDPIDSEKEFKENVHVFDPDQDEIADDSSITLIAESKETKAFLKAAPELLILAKDMKRQMKSQEQLNRFVSDIRMDDIERIEEYDSKMQFSSSSDIPSFKGDITNSKDYHRYLRELEMYERTQIREEYNGKFRTKEEINELELKDTLERAGWNIRALYDNKDKEKRLNKALKADKKREKILKKQLTQVQERSERRMGTYVESYGSSKGKKKKKKKKEDD